MALIYDQFRAVALYLDPAKPSLQRLPSADPSLTVVAEIAAATKMRGTASRASLLHALLDTWDIYECDVLLIDSLHVFHVSCQSDIAANLHRFISKGINVISLGEPWLDTRQMSCSGLIEYVAWISRFSSDLHKERVIEGLAKARSNGVSLGRPADPVKPSYNEVAYLRESRSLSWTEVFKALGGKWSVATLRRIYRTGGSVFE